jgi:hypothetical protein
MNKPPRNPGLAKNQHYVPRCLLRGFASASEKVWVFDKQADRHPFETSVKNVAAEKGFYNLETPSGMASLEPALARLEDLVAPILRRLREEHSLSSLTIEDRATLAFFAVVQLQRTQGHRAKFADMMKQLRDRLSEFGPIPEHTRDGRGHIVHAPLPETPHELRTLTLQMIASAQELAPLLMSKSLVLGQADPADHFYISDNPVAMHNMRKGDLFGNIGLAVPGIEITLPISSSLVLWWICPTYEKLFRATSADIDERWSRSTLEERMRMWVRREKNRMFLRAVDEGTPLPWSVDNALHTNSQQVIHAERFIFSSKNDFALARDMIEKGHAARTGPRGRVM